jgi:putative SOS response-associated peptidase YedK
MCGRYTLRGSRNDLTKLLPFVEFDEKLTPRYNIAPTQEVPVVPNDGKNRLRLFRWGLIPWFARDPSIGNRLINARSETLAEKPSFRTAYRRRRCLILADGFYEWRKNPNGRTKTPMYVCLKSGEPFAFAGLWDAWRPSLADGPPVHSCTIITTDPNTLLERIHNRMPVILKPDGYQAWIDPVEKETAELSHLLTPYPATEMTAHSVSTLVNSPKNDMAQCIEPVDDV